MTRRIVPVCIMHIVHAHQKPCAPGNGAYAALVDIAKWKSKCEQAWQDKVTVEGAILAEKAF
jgi:hypothetical protein